DAVAALHAGPAQPTGDVRHGVAVLAIGDRCPAVAVAPSQGHTVARRAHTLDEHRGDRLVADPRHEVGRAQVRCLRSHPWSSFPRLRDGSHSPRYRSVTTGHARMPG